MGGGRGERFRAIGALTNPHQHSPDWDTCLLTCWGRWGLGAEAQASEVRFQGEDWDWLPEDSLKGDSVPQLARRESGKKSGPAEEARYHCFGVCEERGVLPCVPTEGRAPPKWAPEMGMSHSYPLRHQRQAWNANAAAPATKNPVCKHRSLPTHPHPWGCVHSTATVPISRDNFPGRTHGATQAVAVSHWPCHCRLAPYSNYDYCTPPSPWPERTREP